MARPAAIILFAQTIIGLLKNSSDLPLDILEKDATQKSIIFQRCLAYLLSYQPSKLFSTLGKYQNSNGLKSTLDSKCPTLTLIPSPFLSEDLPLVASRVGLEFLTVLIGSSDVAKAKDWLKRFAFIFADLTNRLSKTSLETSTRMLFQRLVYLKSYLCSPNNHSSEAETVW